jgi:hypothetical protein
MKTAMPRLSENDRNYAVGMLRAGTSVSYVVLHFECSWQTIHNLKTRYATTGLQTLTHLRNRFTPATLLHNGWESRLRRYVIVLDKIEHQFVRVDLIQDTFFWLITASTSYHGRRFRPIKTL